MGCDDDNLYKMAICNFINNTLANDAGQGEEFNILLKTVFLQNSRNGMVLEFEFIDLISPDRPDIFTKTQHVIFQYFTNYL